MKTTKFKSQGLRAIACAGVLSVLLTACGGGGGGGTTGSGAASTSGTDTVAAATWTRCAAEYGTCSFSGMRTVRYGLGDKWATKIATGSIACNNDTFGDPAPGANKICEVSSSTASAPAPTPAPTPSPTPVPGAMNPFGQDASLFELTFSEEFNNGFNRALWNDKIWYEATPDTVNYTVENGVLKIWPQRNQAGRFFNRTIDTDGKYYQTYGYFEIEAKLTKGKGTWPAFWLFNHINERRPEMDVMEAYAGGEGWGFNDAQGIARPSVFAATVWQGLSDSNNVQLGFEKYNAGIDLSESFHKYAVKWEPNKQTYYYDGIPFMVLNISMPDPMYLMLDLWYGSAAGQPDDTTPQGKSNSYEINYVRAWRMR